MAIKKTQKAAEEQTYNVEVTRAHEFKSGDISFDCIVNGVTLYGLTYINEDQKRNIKKAFISFPSRKGLDGNYYNYCWFKITDELFSAIEKQIEGVL